MTLANALTLLAQQAVSDWRFVDVLMTILLTLIGGLTSWVLNTTLQLKNDNTRLKEKVGLDNENGLIRSHRLQDDTIKKLAQEQSEAWRRFERIMNRILRRIERLEDRVGMKAPPDDTEED